MTRLRMEADVVAVGAWDVHVDVLQQIGHLADQHIATTLRVDEIESATEASVCPARERCRAGRVPRIAATAATSSGVGSGRTPCELGTAACRRTVGATPASSATATRAALRLGERGQIDVELLRFPLHVRVKGRRRLGAERSATL